MNYNKAYELVKNNQFSDLELTINDSVNKLVVNVHKIILYSSCIYFEKILTFGKNYPNNIEILVPNTFVIYDIIMSFYKQKTNSGNYPEWKNYLESYRCHDFLGLKFDISGIRHLIVPEEGFELLLDIIELIGYTDETIRLLIKNLPEKYDLKKFPKELLSQMMVLSQNHYCIKAKKKYLHVYDITTGDIVKRIPVGDISSEDIKTYGKIIVLPDNNRIVYMTTNNNIVICSLDNIKKSYVIKNKYYNTSISYLPDSKKICFKTDKKIKIIDTESGNIINSFTCITENPETYNQVISHISYLNEKEIIVVEKYKKNTTRLSFSEIKIFNTITGHYIKNIMNCDYEINKIRSVEKYLAILGYGTYIILLNLETNNIKILRAHTKYIKDIYFNHEGTMLASLSHDGTIIIWEVETGQILYTVPIFCSYENKYICNNSENNKGDYNVSDDNDDNHNYNEYDNDHIHYYHNYCVTPGYNNYPTYMCWTKYKNQILITYNYSGLVLVDYTTLEIIKNSTELRPISCNYLTYYNYNLVERIKEIL
ncbi:putative BTB/POZ domain-containing protein [Moumouvirus australiensis]|uniref:Putative BTB/POZ domain-containing protein n=1 Tax=Moumouvirus australiensis TaxID=2109587 RepID=A0A2P1EKM8_9VIRU|nr:putative BTB/POZ domain-containing protein [Moumouvirus australiensis]AVL94425.1 putative BTB/POZ domain-containing protein [Moumouvirus australiensis]